jgi:ADP-heptose:LPS heptosyltransferase
VVLSPAGAFASRNWPIERYARFAELWQQQYSAQFAILGLDSLRQKAAALKASLGEDHALCLHSGDLACGACMEPTCQYGDVHCLTRYVPEYVVDQAEALIAHATTTRVRIVSPKV